MSLLPFLFLLSGSGGVFVNAHPIDVHFHGKLLRIDFSGGFDPTAAELHIDEDVKRFVERPLTVGFFCGNARVGEGFLSVNGKNEFVRMPFHGVNVVVVALDFS